ncbi:hypothetical protein DUZ99_11795 [Xylanibacillus composti]|uniref:Uncharacterized protein n=1 Tax=Xylanibacillus composti TaxID=1572762 RepID=A0A8J4H1L0_9BACL|nr:hypothetical protein [Xylanibacillus composti]MDT9725656.1 hypothetical protein [Xylanibacillus composti]GIQ67751.1 hypothetical protein XYCOK13_05750 [Xylanibacillus composti]
MKCTITYYDPASQRVEFSSVHGHAAALWTGKAVESGVEVEAELGLLESLAWGVDALELDPEETADDSAFPTIRMEKGKVVLTGLLAEEGPDGECSLRLGEDEVEFEAVGTPPRTGTRIQLRTKQLVLYAW